MGFKIQQHRRVWETVFLNYVPAAEDRLSVLKLAVCVCERCSRKSDSQQLISTKFKCPSTGIVGVSAAPAGG